jgi:hypothetical protein
LRALRQIGLDPVGAAVIHDVERLEQRRVCLVSDLQRVAAVDEKWPPSSINMTAMPAEPVKPVSQRKPLRAAWDIFALMLVARGTRKPSTRG